MMLAALQLIACNEIAELGDENPDCIANEDCEPGETPPAVAPTEPDDPAPELEREADDLGKLGVERDMLESKVKLASEQLQEAEEELRDAASDADKTAARAKRTKASSDHKLATQALERFKAEHTK